MSNSERACIYYACANSHICLPETRARPGFQAGRCEVESTPELLSFPNSRLASDFFAELCRAQLSSATSHKKQYVTDPTSRHVGSVFGSRRVAYRTRVRDVAGKKKKSCGIVAGSKIDFDRTDLKIRRILINFIII